MEGDLGIFDAQRQAEAAQQGTVEADSPENTTNVDAEQATPDDGQEQNKSAESAVNGDGDNQALVGEDAANGSRQPDGEAGTSANLGPTSNNLQPPLKTDGKNGVEASDMRINNICDDLSEDDCSSVLDEAFNRIVLKIQTQNKIINSVKEIIHVKASKCSRTACEDKEICNLNVCIQEESKKLNNLLRQAQVLQERYPNRKWSAIQLATTYTEDHVPAKLNLCRPFSETEDMCDSESFMKSGAKASKRSKNDGHLYADLFDKALPSAKRKGYQFTNRDNDPLFKQLHPANRRGFSLDPTKRPKLRNMNFGLENIKKANECRLVPQQLIKCIQKKIDNIHKELRCTGCVKQGSERQDNCCTVTKPESLVGRCKKDLTNLMLRSQDIMGCKKSVNSNQNGKGCLSFPCGESNGTPQGNDKQKVSIAEYEDLKSRYFQLLEKFSQKEREVTKLKATVRNLNYAKVSAKQTALDSSSEELVSLRERLQACEKYHEDFKVVLCEQARQIDEYRAKYMGALQEVEEQRLVSQKFEMDKNIVESQVNNEIQRIKDRFNRQLEEYDGFPQLLENEQIKLAECCREKDDMESKLRVVCRDYKSLKNAFNEKTREHDDPDKFKKLSDELTNLKQQYDLLKLSKDELSRKCEETRQELDAIRSESVKIISRVKERSAINQTILQEHIDELERGMAKCRANASQSITDKDVVIKDMQAQLNCLALSFDVSQKQIKILKERIAYLSKGKTNSVVICCGTETCKC